MTEHHPGTTPADRRGASHGGRRGARPLAAVTGGVLALGLAAGVAVWQLDAPRASDAAAASEDVQHLGPTEAGVPSVQRVVTDDETALTVAVGPATPGENVVRLDISGPAAGHGAEHGSEHGSDHGSDEAGVLIGSTGTEPVAAQAVPGTDGLWARVDLETGSDEVVVELDGVRHTLPVDTGEQVDVSPAWRSADAPECLSASVAVLAAGEDPDVGACPSDELSRADATTLGDTVETLAARGVRRLAVRADDSERSTAALDTVREAAEGSGVEVVDPDAPATGRTALLEVAGWETSAEGLAAVSRLPLTEQPVRSDGTWLAPWLLSRGVVDSTSGAVLPLDFDIRSADAARYADLVRTLLPGQAPTSSGYAAFAEARGTKPQPVQLYAASRASILMAEPPTDGSPTHNHATQISWFPGGTITPVGTLEAAGTVLDARENTASNTLSE
ncbi:hypothetical protein [uncultured Nocardioides sp.]|uniref:hypothetical protein n=1 Tax=uncultured Nocardioides sp. TaxID=198441 RepID=UPI00260D6859|nr:hypothetical protein [uncultured Nocardioides sp.]